jgi:hypothetical protein
VKWFEKAQEDFKWMFRPGYRILLLDQYQAAAFDEGAKAASAYALSRVTLSEGPCDGMVDQHVLIHSAERPNPYRSKL